MNRIAQLLSLALLSLSISGKTYAHPHSWIDLQTGINISNNTITSLTMSWEFDAMTSAYMLSGEKINDANRSEILSRIANEVIENMLSSHYFTYLYQGDTPIRYKEVKQANLSRNGAKLTLDFELELVEVLPVNTPDLSLLIFDPTYFVDMNWENQDSLTLSKAHEGMCQIEVIQPEPTTEQLAYAMSLPMDADPDSELGKLFTQTALINCQSEES